MGSESLPATLFESIMHAAFKLPHVSFLIFATSPAIQEISQLKQFQDFILKVDSPVKFHIIDEVIDMDDEPVAAVRQKKNSSLVVGLRLLKRKQLSAFISAGNTGALITGAAIFLPKLPGIKRPALLATLPTEKGEVAVIDVGGNVLCKAHHLAQFAAMGAAYQRCCYGIKLPRVGLLNIGVESKKGTSEVQRAYKILQEHHAKGTSRMEFVGNIEGRGVFQGEADVLVTDGFTGNVLLKTSEGVSVFLLNQLKHIVKNTMQGQKASVFYDLTSRFDYEEHCGAIICGVDSIVIKCHGKSSVKGFFNGIKGAVALAENDFIAQLKKQLAE
ncbi:MAG: phosphate acyltransferase PlsX [Candidatus Protochlamydia sp.]|nr:phosphate acyltransferase PlsX [Candidatus Protochlamydia sp.]